MQQRIYSSVQNTTFWLVSPSKKGGAVLSEGTQTFSRKLAFEDALLYN
jgi:hypothetical protein